MKKHLLSISIVLVAFIAKAQTSITVTDNSTSAVISNSATIYATTTGSAAEEKDFTVKNTSGGTISYHVRRTDIVLNKISSSDSAVARFCFGTACFVPTTTITPTPVAIASNATQSLKTYLDEATISGLSKVKYQIFNASNVNDIFTFTIFYNSPLKVKENADILESVSDVFPNPSTNKAQLIINSNVNTSNVIITITNALGSTVSTKTIDLYNGKNAILLDIENLNTGIYFAAISTSNNKIVKKFTINK